MSVIFLIAGALFLGYALIYKPQIIAVVLFVVIIAQINVFNLRPLLTLALFGRILIDKKSRFDYPLFLSRTPVKLLIVLMLYSMMVAFWQNLFNYDLFKGELDTVILTFCIYYYFFRFGNANLLKTAVIISGLICFCDLAYTYAVFGSFPIHRLYFEIGGFSQHLSEEDLTAMANWNFFGEICGITFVYVLSDFVRSRSDNKYMIWLLPVMLMGVVMSTSRSSILGLLLISILIILNGINYKEQKRRISKIIALGFGAVFVGFLLMATVGKYVNLDAKFVEDISDRLLDEPMAILKKATGQSYNVQNLGSMDWREESAENAYASYMGFPLNEQLFGIGIRGFETRNIGHGYNAHNAFLLLLIENGIVGAGLYFLITLGTVIRAILLKNVSPALASVCFILIYGLGQNREWTEWTTYLFVFCLVAENEFIPWSKRNNHADLSQDKPVNL